MTQISNQRRTIDKLRAAYIVTSLLICSCATSAATNNQFHAEKDHVIVFGRIVRLQGACSSIGCPALQYEIEVFKVQAKDGTTKFPQDDMSSITACGTSGLMLGEEYRFELKRNDGIRLAAADRALSYEGEFVRCDFFFDTVVRKDKN